MRCRLRVLKDGWFREEPRIGETMVRPLRPRKGTDVAYAQPAKLFFSHQVLKTQVGRLGLKLYCSYKIVGQGPRMRYRECL